MVHRTAPQARVSAADLTLAEVGLPWRPRGEITAGSERWRGVKMHVRALTRSRGERERERETERERERDESERESLIRNNGRD